VEAPALRIRASRAEAWERGCGGDRPLFLEIHVTRGLFEEEVSALGSHHAVAELLTQYKKEKCQKKKNVEQIPCRQ